MIAAGIGVGDMTQPQGRDIDSTWTFASLREYLLRIVADLSARQSQLADAQDKAVQAALVAQEKAVQAALAAADKAVSKAETAAEAWRSSANEWRGSMSDRERTFLPRTEHTQSVVTLNEKIEMAMRKTEEKLELLERWVTRTDASAGGKKEQQASNKDVLALIVGVLGMAGGVLVALLKG